MQQTVEVTRDQLLVRLREAGFPVSRAMLLRWQAVGVLPRPRRKGLGRGKGIAVLYPEWTIGLAAVIANALKLHRNLDWAAWTAWILGFPLTLYVKDLLLEEFSDTIRSLQREHRRMAKSDKRSALHRVSRGTVPRALKGMRTVLPPESLAKSLRIVLEQQLGALRTEQYTSDDWQRLQDGFVAEFLPGVQDDDALPSSAEVAAGYQVLSDEQSLPRIVNALRRMNPRVLEMVRNEAQALTEHVAQAVGAPVPIISTDEFLRYFAFRIVNRQTREQATDTIRLLGWKRPPDPPVIRWARASTSQETGVSP